eukprot:scaffold3170_cov54-Phaeocystis_antarctica.AAC.7
MGDGRDKHDVCPICVKLKVPTTYWCCVNCPGNPAAWKRHAVYHKQVKRYREATEDGGAVQQRDREIAERQARIAAQSGDAYEELVADGLRYLSKQDFRRAARAFREAIALRPDRPTAYYNLGAALCSSAHQVEAAQRYLEAKERYAVGSEGWAKATAMAFSMLRLEVCDEAAKPEWWNDEGLKALSARVVRAAPNDVVANQMRASVLSGQRFGFGAGPRSAAELMEAATHYERAAALCPAPARKAEFAGWSLSVHRPLFAPAVGKFSAHMLRIGRRPCCQQLLRAGKAISSSATSSRCVFTASTSDKREAEAASPPPRLPTPSTDDAASSNAVHFLGREGKAISTGVTPRVPVSDPTPSTDGAASYGAASSNAVQLSVLLGSSVLLQLGAPAFA